MSSSFITLMTRNKLNMLILADSCNVFFSHWCMKPLEYYHRVSYSLIPHCYPPSNILPKYIFFSDSFTNSPSFLLHDLFLGALILLYKCGYELVSSFLSLNALSNIVISSLQIHIQWAIILGKITDRLMIDR